MTSRLVRGVFLVSIAVVIAGLAHLRRLSLQRPPGLTYEEEEPGRIFEGFKFSERVAAESYNRRHLAVQDEYVKEE